MTGRHLTISVMTGKISDHQRKFRSVWHEFAIGRRVV